MTSLFGLSGVIEARAKVPKTQDGSVFYWADLKTGQIGFPTGVVLNAELPGSLMKLIAASALMEESVINSNHIVNCSGLIDLDGQKFTCLHPHGRIDLVHALSNSCNVYFGTVSHLLPSSLFLRYARLYYLDRGVAHYPPGHFPQQAQPRSWKYVLGVDENLTLNGLQVLRMSAIIGLSGKVPPLHSAEDEPEDTLKAFKLSERTWTVLHEGMQLACLKGTAHNLDPKGLLHIAAKTGTAPHGKKCQSWVTGFFPYQSPRYAFSLNCPTGSSLQTAVPRAREFLLGTTWPF